MTTLTKPQIKASLKHIQGMLQAVANVEEGEDIDITLQKIGFALVSSDTRLIPTHTAKAIVDLYRIGLTAKEALLKTDLIYCENAPEKVS